MKKKCIAIVLSAGSGKRMGTKVAKQYLEVQGKPILYYSLHAMEQSQIIDEIILVVGEGQIDYVKETIVEAYGFQKITAVIEGGRERYDSVFCGLSKIKEQEKQEDKDLKDFYIFIHDGARPFATEEILNRAYTCVDKYKACVVGMPAKDTIKIADEDGFAKETPNRAMVWTVQTPQVFAWDLIYNAYEKVLAGPHNQVTDDAMVVESATDTKVKFVEGSYENIKITTPEDLKIAEIFLK